DAAHMMTITAKEGDPTAQRELGFFIRSNPELVGRPTLPLSKGREVFKQTVMEHYGPTHHQPASRYSSEVAGLRLGGGGGAGPARVGADVRTDPALMCIAIHWMESATRGGDKLAKMFLAQNVGGS